MVNKFISVKVQEKISDFIKAYGVPAIAITRLSSLSNDSLSFVAGILKMDYWKYILATLSGRINGSRKARIIFQSARIF